MKRQGHVLVGTRVHEEGRFHLILVGHDGLLREAPLLLREHVFAFQHQVTEHRQQDEQGQQTARARLEGVTALIVKGDWLAVDVALLHEVDGAFCRLGGCFLEEAK